MFCQGTHDEQSKSREELQPSFTHLSMKVIQTALLLCDKDTHYVLVKRLLETWEVTKPLLC